MNIAEQIKAFYVFVDQYTGAQTFDWQPMLAECEQKGTPEQDWENETTEYIFADGSVLKVWNQEVTAYGAKA
jgi:hypothetical protein